MSAYVKKPLIPETIVGEAGTAKRNIIRKGGGGGRDRKGDIAGKAVDDGSIYDDGYALDKNDPNYDSEEEGRYVKVPTYAALHREEIRKSKLTLTAYKRLVQPIIAEYFLSFDAEEVVKRIQVTYSLLPHVFLSYFTFFINSFRLLGN